MKANRLAKDEGGDFGIGTMIIFIAMIVVAVVAATVIIEVMNRLQGNAYNTGLEATQRVSSGVDVRLVTMERARENPLGGLPAGLGSSLGSLGTSTPVLGDLFSSPSEYVGTITVTLQLRAGSQPIGLDKLTLTVLTPRDMQTYSGGETESSIQYSEIRTIMDDDGSIENMHALNRIGDVAEVVLDVSSLKITPGTRFTVRTTPEVGMAASIDCTVPVGYAYDATALQLYP
ncbi:MAG: hypothetical protein SVE93_08385 [Candidatus Thermoplasmatota archaeon]|nr:hypothetical protein [Candidatus Thermoplasmatota archaeon]